MESKEMDYQNNLSFFNLFEANNEYDFQQINNVVENFKNFNVNSLKKYELNNLVTGEFIWTKQGNNFLNKFYKKDLTFENLLYEYQNNDNLINTYLLYNILFINKSLRRDNNILKIINTIKYKNEEKLPSLGKFKIYLHLFKYIFNSNKKFSFINFIEIMNNQTINFEKTLNKDKQSKDSNIKKENNILTNIFYASKCFYYLDKNQNNFCTEEIQLFISFFKIISSTIFDNKIMFEKFIDDFSSNIVQLLEKNKFVNLEENHISNSINNDKLVIFIGIRDKGLESFYGRKMIKHLYTLKYFLNIYKYFRYENNIKECLNILYKTILNNTVSSKMSTTFVLSKKYIHYYLNNIGTCQIKLRNKKTNISPFIKALNYNFDFKNKKNPEKDIYKIDLNCEKPKIIYNIGLVFYQNKNYESCKNTLEKIIINFKDSYLFWMRLGLTYYNLYLIELKNLMDNKNYFDEKNLSKIKTNSKYQNLKLLFLNNKDYFKIYLDKYIERKINFDENKIYSNLEKAINSFNNSLILIEKEYSEKNDKKMNDLITDFNFKNLSKEIIINLNNNLNIKYEIIILHLCFLFLCIEEPLKCLNHIEDAINSRRLNGKVQVILNFYKSESLNKLFKNKLSLDIIETKIDNGLLNKHYFKYINFDYNNNINLSVCDGKMLTTVNSAIINFKNNNVIRFKENLKNLINQFKNKKLKEIPNIIISLVMIYNLKIKNLKNAKEIMEKDDIDLSLLI